MSSIAKTILGDNWRIRRRWMSAILVWMVGIVTWLVFYGSDTGLHQNIAVTMLGTIAAIIGAYVFGAAWEDTAKIQHGLYETGPYDPQNPNRIDSGEE